MTDAWLATIPLADLVAPAFFLLAWAGYALYADREHRRPNLMSSASFCASSPGPRTILLASSRG